MQISGWRAVKTGSPQLSKIIMSPEENDIETFYTEDINSYEFAINGFQGTLNGFQTFEIEDTDEEQYYRLYPVTNDSGISYSRDLSLNTPYDEEEVNLDNILITMTIE